MNEHGRSLARLVEWLIVLRDRGGSDLYLVAGLPPSIRIHGTIQQLPERPLEGQEIETPFCRPCRRTLSTAITQLVTRTLRSAATAKDDFGSTCIANAAGLPRASGLFHCVRRNCESWGSRPA